MKISEFDQFFRVGIIQTTLDAVTAYHSGVKMCDVEEERAISEIRQHIAALASEQKLPDLILLPEISVPLGFLDRLRGIAVEMNSIIIAGMDFEEPPHRRRAVWNRAAVIVPNKWGRNLKSTASTLRYVGKTYPAHREEKKLREFNYEFEKIPHIWVFEAERFGRFAVAICFDFLDLERVATYRLNVQHLFILAYNPDIPTFDHAAEAMARMIYCNVVVCNSGTFGGSIAVSPYQGAERRLLYRHTGIGLATSQVIQLPVQRLVMAQRDEWPSGEAREFKSLPPGSKPGRIQLSQRHTSAR